jgi:hypothetical protein
MMDFDFSSSMAETMKAWMYPDAGLMIFYRFLMIKCILSFQYSPTDRQTTRSHSTSVAVWLTMALLDCSVIRRAVFLSFPEFEAHDDLKISVVTEAVPFTYFHQSLMNPIHDDTN